MSTFQILSTGSYVPEKIIFNQDLSVFLDTNDDWIKQRVGISQRHVSVDETTSEIGCKAALRALEMNKTDSSELDMIICATITPEYKSPNLACMIQKHLGAKCPAMDVNCACSSFIYALDTAAGFFSRKKVKKVLVVGAERLSSIVDWKDRGTAVIFGDGAGAVLLGEGDSYRASVLNAQGNDDIICIPNNEGESPFFNNRGFSPFIMMKGQETFKFAVKAICNDLKKVISDSGLSENEISWVVPHQANSRIIDYAKNRMNISPEKFYINIDKFGNTSSASIPMVLDELNRAGKLKKGENIALCAFGGGLSSGACIITW